MMVSISVEDAERLLEYLKLVVEHDGDGTIYLGGKAKNIIPPIIERLESVVEEFSWATSITLDDSDLRNVLKCFKKFGSLNKYLKKHSMGIWVA